MREIPIPKPLQTLVEAEGPIRLSQDQICKIQQAEAELDAGMGLSVEELRAHFDAKKAAWTQSKNA